MKDSNGDTQSKRNPARSLHQKSSSQLPPNMNNALKGQKPLSLQKHKLLQQMKHNENEATEPTAVTQYSSGLKSRVLVKGSGQRKKRAAPIEVPSQAGSSLNQVPGPSLFNQSQNVSLAEQAEYTKLRGDGDLTHVIPLSNSKVLQSCTSPRNQAIEINSQPVPVVMKQQYNFSTKNKKDELLSPSQQQVSAELKNLTQSQLQNLIKNNAKIKIQQNELSNDKKYKSGNYQYGFNVAQSVGFVQPAQVNQKMIIGNSKLMNNLVNGITKAPTAEIYRYEQELLLNSQMSKDLANLKISKS